jgi:hypothetical protein
MKLTALTILSIALVTTTSSAFAYQLKEPPKNDECKADGNPCNVFCDNGYQAGTMYWNGSVWTDGVKWDPDKNTEARKIVAANGTACT